MDKNTKFLHTLIEYLESDERGDISCLLKPATLQLIYTSEFIGGIVWNQRKCNIEIKVRVPSKKRLEENKIILKQYCRDLFEETEEYALGDIIIGVLMDDAPVMHCEEEKDVNHYSRTQVYQNLLDKINISQLNETEAMYLREACQCAIAGQRLAASIMIGCAAEFLLVQLCNAYLLYLQNGNGTESEINNFRRDAIEADKARKRLDKFKRVVQNKEGLFKSLGLENSNLHFGFLDIIRQVRNESGHPTGTRISEEDLNSIFVNYQLLIDRVHPVIQELPKA